MNNLVLILLLAFPFIGLAAIVAWLTVTVGRETRGGK
jgi:hypothetical protein